MCGMLLADFGAEVIRVDRLKAPHIATTCLGRGKKSIALDLKSADGLAAFRKLAKSVDVLIEPYRPGVMERLQLGPDELCMENPGLIYARLTGTIHCVWVKILVLVPLLLLVRCVHIHVHANASSDVPLDMPGWGQTGEDALTAGHDINYIALSGALSLFGRPGEKPLPPVRSLSVPTPLALCLACTTLNLICVIR